MKKAILVLLFFISLLSCGFKSKIDLQIPKMQPVTILVPAEVFKSFDNYVQIKTRFWDFVDNMPISNYSDCNGVHIKEYVVTAAHCIPLLGFPIIHELSIVDNKLIMDEKGSSYELVSIDINGDLAILKNKNAVLDYLELEPAVVNIGEPIYYVDKYLQIKKSHISKVEVPLELETGQYIVGYEFPDVPMYGNSGSPVWNEKGELIGIISAALFEANLSYFVLIY